MGMGAIHMGAIPAPTTATAKDCLESPKSDRRTCGIARYHTAAVVVKQAPPKR